MLEDKNRNFSIVASLVPRTFALSLLVVVAYSPLSLNAQNKDNYQQQIDTIALQITTITKSLNTDKAALKTERDALLEQEKKINKLNQEIVQLEQAISSKTDEIGKLTDQTTLLKQESEGDRVALQALIRQRYMQRNSHYLKILLDQKNPYAVGRLQHYYDYVHKAQQSKLAALHKKADQLTVLQQDLNAQQSAMQRSMQDHSEKRLSLNTSKHSREQKVARLSAKVDQGAKKLDRLKADRARLGKLLTQLAQQAEKLKRLEQQRKQQSEVSRNQPDRTLKSGGFLKQKGRLKAPVRGRLKYQYGSRMVESGMRAEGVFFNTEQPRPVHSIFSGQVLFADFLKGYGLLIIVDHGDQHISLYGHNELLYKKVGDMVDTNEVISKSGTTGGLRQAGLYFEIRKNATPIDPAKWCQL